MNGSPFRAPGPELFFAIVSPVGADTSVAMKALRQALGAVNYEVHTIHLIELLHDFNRWQNLPEAGTFDRYESHMTAGNEFRAALQTPDAFSLLGAARTLAKRMELHPEGRDDEPRPRTAYVFRSLKRPEEVTTFRDIYGPDGFFAIAAHSPPQERLSFLEREIRSSSYSEEGDPPRMSPRMKAQHLIERDEREPGEEEYGQLLTDTFPQADLFVEASDSEKTQQAIDRFISLLFGFPFHTPVPDEYAMFLAMGSALRSADLGRQVGAAIASKDGEVLSVGTNEVPKAGGGLYWEGDEPDRRDWRLNYVPSYDMRRQALGQVLDRLSKAGWLTQEVSARIQDASEAESLVQDAVRVTKGTQLTEVTEYGRSVHAEMDALTYAARQGIAVRGATLFTTTFPCHVCARHIVAAGIERVVYNEPYPKSLASFLHMDSLSVDQPGDAENQVRFEPFVGIAPRRYIDFFLAGQRKTPDGRIVDWEQSSSQPRLHTPHSTYYRNENLAVDLLKRLRNRAGL